MVLLSFVDSYGNVNAIGEGKTKIVVRSENGVTGEVDVVIKKSKKEVQEIKLTETSINLKKGNKAKITAIVTPIDAVNQQITWKSDNGNVTVDNNGNIVAKNIGTSTIVAITANGKSATCKVTVTDETIQVTGVSLNTNKKQMTVGQQDYLVAKISPDNATDRNIIWSSSNTKVVSVTDGKITALSAGNAVIIAKSKNGKTATCVVDVKKEEKVVSQVEVTGIELNITNTTLDIGGTVNLSAKISPNNATNKTVIWTSNNDGVASVSNGTVTAKQAGTAVITAKSVNGKEASCVIVVRSNAIEVTSIKLDTTGVKLEIGKSIALHATVEPADATNKSITWISSNDKIASVDGSGNVTAKRTGTATIIAKTNNGKEASATISISGNRIHFLKQTPDANGNMVSSDCIILESNGKFALVDAGYVPAGVTYENTNLAKYIDKMGITRFEFIILSHIHSDHTGSMIDVINRMDVGSLYIKKGLNKEHSAYNASLTALNNFLNSIAENKKSIVVDVDGTNVHDKSEILLGNMRVFFFNTKPLQDKHIGENANSIVNVVRVNDFKVLLTGDLNYRPIWDDLVNSVLSKYTMDIMKVGHHGFHNCMGESGETRDSKAAKLKVNYYVVTNSLNNSLLDEKTVKDSDGKTYNSCFYYINQFVNNTSAKDIMCNAYYTNDLPDDTYAIIADLSDKKEIKMSGGGAETNKKSSKCR